MAQSHGLLLYEEILLLTLHGQKGTPTCGPVRYIIAGAVMAELFLEGRITIGGRWKHLVVVNDPTPTGDVILDACLARIAGSRGYASLKGWIGRVARTKDMYHRTARQLCQKGILRQDETNVLLVFTRRIYPEVNSLPKKTIIDRLRGAIATSGDAPDPRTVVLLSLARGTRLLAKNLSRDEVKLAKARIKEIIKGEAMGKATREAIEARQAAAAMGAIIPGVIGGSHH